MKALITGACGQVGSHVAEMLLARGDEVLGIDNLNDYYEVSLKEARLARLVPHPHFRFERLDIADRAKMQALFARERYDAVAHLAAQAGVRYSLTHPQAYVDANLVGFGNVLEGCRAAKPGHLVYASSSSVYGLNAKMPFDEDDNVDHPVSLYAATKKANELMAHTYAHLYGLPCTGLRFFTVYGPWGRPDMSPFLFLRAMLAGEPIKVFNRGEMQRDFTYIDDVVEGVVRVIDRPPAPGTAADLDSPATSSAPYRVYNIGNSQPVPLLEYVATFERALGIRAQLELLPMQPGDVVATAADTSRLEGVVGFRPSTPLAIGVQRFVDWYREHYGIAAPPAAAV
jgi:UDP-glucuronate 4-epimerase